MKLKPKNHLLYIAYEDISSKASGINKKILQQISAFRSLGYHVSVSYLHLDVYNHYDSRYIDGRLFEAYKNIFMVDRKHHWRFKHRELLKYIFQEDVKIVYLRYVHFANPFFLAFLHKLYKSDIKIIMEIPTYPYDLEYKHAKKKIRLFQYIEHASRKMLKYYVNRIVTYSKYEYIYRIKTVKIHNGINYNTVPIKIKRPQKNELNLICVSSMEYWHGYDRVIEGLKDYYRSSYSYRVNLHCVGNTTTPEALKYKQLVKLYKLSTYVVFHGIQYGEELDVLFDQCDLAIGCLGVHRKGIKHIKSLKNSEYCARGIPFMYAENDDTFDREKFVIKIPPDDSPVDINKIIDSYRTIQKEPALIRDYAILNLSWHDQMEKVIKALI